MLIWPPAPALPSPPTPRGPALKPKTVTRLKFAHSFKKKKKKKVTGMSSPLERVPFFSDYKVFSGKILKQRNNLQK